MCKWILQFVKATFAVLAGLSTLMHTALSQQNIIADKDNTHPEQSRGYYMPARILAFTAVQQNGYNEVQWAAVNEADTRRYIIEYSADGFNWTSAGEMVPNTGVYNLKHTINDDRSLLYRD